MGRSFVSKTVVVEEEIMQWTPEEKKETSRNKHFWSYKNHNIFNIFNQIKVLRVLF